MQLDESDAHSHYMGTKLDSMQDNLDHKKSEFSVLAAEYYRMTNKRRRLLSDFDYERRTKRVQAPDYCGGLTF